MLDIGILNDKFGWRSEIMNGTTQGRVQVVPEGTNNVIGIERIRNRIVGEIGSVSAKGEISVGADLNHILIDAIEREDKGQ